MFVPGKLEPLALADDSNRTKLLLVFNEANQS
jgi:hypothetical protein